MEVELKKKGIAAFTHYIPLHSAPAGLKYCRIGSDMSVTERVGQTLLRLPVWPDLSEEEVSYIIQCLADLLGNISTSPNPTAPSSPIGKRGPSIFALP